METKKKRKAEGKHRPKVDNTCYGGIGQMKNKQVSDHSNCPKPPIMVHSSSCPKLVLQEHSAHLDKMTNVNCAAIFALRHWNSIVEIDKKHKAYDGSVRIFYANMYDVEKEDLKFKSYMTNVHFEVNPDLISKILKVPSPFIVDNTVTYPYKNLIDKPTT
ncbi:unnamed protein product [Ilex paraguariensis]|uniref:Uncharacterized protein n=1 Tax=Ilex paraguariensis TaxID=185542 RepID=A0ABC8T021_9AQUA